MASNTPNDTRVTARLPASVKDTLQKAGGFNRGNLKSIYGSCSG